MNRNSEIIARMTVFLFPMIIVFGFYIILNGHASPGGGFQGGAMLASVFITRYLVYPVEDFQMKMLQIMEKVLFLGIVLVPVLFLFVGQPQSAGWLHLPYLILMNLLIGLKVCAGLVVIFFRFVFYEGGKA